MKVHSPFVPLLLMMTWITFPGALAQNPRGTGINAAKEQMSNFQVADGLGVQLFACEPMVVNPTYLEIDQSGRVWVLEGVNYRSWQSWGKLRSDGDRILILEDTNDDAVADKSTVFYQGNEINAAQGICVLDHRVIVSSSPNVWIFSDTNGDDKADKKEILFTGIGGADHDHGVHGVMIGPDGKLYFNFGSQGSRLLHANGSPATDRLGRIILDEGDPFHGGMSFRCNLDGSQLEVIGHNFRNSFETAVDSFGNIWQSDYQGPNSYASRFVYILESGNFGYLNEISGQEWTPNESNHSIVPHQQIWHQKDPGVVPNILNSERNSPAGLTVYEGELLPHQFQNQIFQCDQREQKVKVLRPQAKGAGYQLGIKSIVSSQDPWFRPHDIATAPDGSLMFSDWNDGEWEENKMSDLQTASMSGRIYRISPVDNTPYSIKTPSIISAKDAVTALKSPNPCTRYQGWKRVKNLKSKAVPELLSLWRDKKPLMRVRALHLLGRLKDQGKHFLNEAILDSDERIRAAAVRIAFDQNQHLIELISQLKEDPSPVVRRECAIALRFSKSMKAPKLWASLAMKYDGKDLFYLEALGIGSKGNEDSCFEAWLELVGEEWKAPAGRDIVWRSRSKLAPAKLVGLIKDAEIGEEEKNRIRRALDFFNGPEKDAALLQLIDR